MSLFDVIRYPITDIFDHGEIGQLPREIIIPWLQDCYDFLGNNDRQPTDLKNAVSAATWVHILLIKAATEHEDTGREEYVAALKGLFTLWLRERIEKHE
jgi:hypothetical protein